MESETLIAQLKAKDTKEGEAFIIIGVPLGDNWQIDARTAMWVECQRHRPNVWAKYLPSKHVSHGRNTIVNWTLDNIPEATHIFFIDRDTIPPADALDKLIAHDKDVITAVVPLFSDFGPSWSVMKYDADEKIDNAWRPIPYRELPDELFRAHHFGAAAELVKRYVFESIDWPYYQDCFNKNKIILGQDLYFTALAKKAGFELWCDPTVKCEHARYAEYKRMYDTIFDGQEK